MKHDWAPLPTGQQCELTELTVFRWLAAVAAIVTSVSAGFIAHYEFGFSRQEIRALAVTGAVIIALLVGTEYLCQTLRRPESTRGRDR